MACGAASRPFASHRAAGRGDGSWHADLRRTCRKSTQCRPRLDRARRRARGSRGLDAADQYRLFHRLLRHPLCRGHSRADLPAHAALAARGSSPPSDHHSAQRWQLHAHHNAGGAAARQAAPPASRKLKCHCERCGRGDVPATGRSASNQRPSFDRAHPVHIREHGRSERRCAQSRQPACQCSSDGRRHGRKLCRRLRQLAAALSRHGLDWRLARMSALCRGALCHVALELPRAARELAMGNSPLSRHLFRVSQFRLRTLPE